MKKRKTKNIKPAVHNAGSGDFNLGSQQKDGAKKVITIPDQEKLTGHRRLDSTNKNK